MVGCEWIDLVIPPEFPRRNTRQVMVGGIPIGGGSPVSVQTMTKTKTADIDATVAQIVRSADAGADIVRVTVNDAAAADAIGEIVRQSPVPIVADIHFNHIYALRSIEGGVAKVRINPGNIGSEERIRQVLEAAGGRDIPIRIGVNSGSLEKDILEKYGFPTAEALYDSAMRHAGIAEKFGFSGIIIAVKSTSVAIMIAAYRLIAARTDYPLHLGVTEAGTIKSGTVKSAVGIGALLAEGIGDTIRVSLTDEPEREVEVGRDILRSLGMARRGVEIISCPTCGRLETNLFSIVNELEEKVRRIDKNIKVAILGCAVNGPGEAKEADLGVACGKNEAILFKKGEIIRKLPESEILVTLYQEILDY
ncbi:MAG: flavodoxin-dependent (E)-4-hydroxy-3-methylbut-2-enyl-diphosphate synthase [Candidatus Kapaibacterium sp.]